MIKKAPARPQMAAIALFVVSCVLLLVFLWVSSGGTVPLGARGYRIEIEFPQAVELATQSDVRISGISVGKVVSTSFDRKTGLTRAVLELERAYTPRPVDTRATLRQKSLLGETYVDLSPGSRSEPSLLDDAMLPQAQVAPTVQLDQILSTFDPTTRQAFSTWMQQGGIALTDRGASVNQAIAALYPFATNVDPVLAVLHREDAATQGLISGGAQTFAALARSPAALQGLIRNANTVFGATATRDTRLSATIRAFPAFLQSTRTTIDRITRFGAETKPLVDQLRPAARQLSPALIALRSVSPQLRTIFDGLGPLTRASQAGVPALERFLDQSVPLLTRAKPYLGGVVPVLQYLGTYRRELAAFFANATAATNATQPTAAGERKNYVRATQPVSPESVTAYPARISTSRSNPYLEPSGYSRLSSGLPVFGSWLCSSAAPPSIGPTVSPADAATLRTFYYTADPGGPPCVAQAPLGASTGHGQGAFPRLTPLP